MGSKHIRHLCRKCNKKYNDENKRCDLNLNSQASRSCHIQPALATTSMYVMSSLSFPKKTDSWLSQMVVLFLWCPMFDVTKRTKHDSCLFMLIIYLFIYCFFPLGWLGFGTWKLVCSLKFIFNLFF